MTKLIEVLRKSGFTNVVENPDDHNRKLMWFDGTTMIVTNLCANPDGTYNIRANDLEGSRSKLLHLDNNSHTLAEIECALSLYKKRLYEMAAEENKGH